MREETRGRVGDGCTIGRCFDTALFHDFAHLVVSERELQAPPLHKDVHDSIHELLAGDHTVRRYFEQLHHLSDGRKIGRKL